MSNIPGRIPVPDIFYFDGIAGQQGPVEAPLTTYHRVRLQESNPGTALSSTLGFQGSSLPGWLCSTHISHPCPVLCARFRRVPMAQEAPLWFLCFCLQSHNCLNLCTDTAANSCYYLATAFNICCKKVSGSFVRFLGGWDSPNPGAEGVLGLAGMGTSGEVGGPVPDRAPRGGTGQITESWKGLEWKGP